MSEINLPPLFDVDADYLWKDEDLREYARQAVLADRHALATLTQQPAAAQPVAWAGVSRNNKLIVVHSKPGPDPEQLGFTPIYASAQGKPEAQPATEDVLKAEYQDGYGAGFTDAKRHMETKEFPSVIAAKKSAAGELEYYKRMNGDAVISMPVQPTDEICDAIAKVVKQSWSYDDMYGAILAAGQLMPIIEPEITDDKGARLDAALLDFFTTCDLDNPGVDALYQAWMKGQE